MSFPEAIGRQPVLPRSPSATFCPYALLTASLASRERYLFVKSNSHLFLNESASDCALMNLPTLRDTYFNYVSETLLNCRMQSFVVELNIWPGGIVCLQHVPLLKAAPPQIDSILTRGHRHLHVGNICCDNVLYTSSKGSQECDEFLLFVVQVRCPVFPCNRNWMRPNAICFVH